MRSLMILILVVSFFSLTHKPKAPSYKGVDWSYYNPIVKERVDKAIYNNDCSRLQSEFSTADENNASQRRRTGKSNLNLMDFLHQAMERLGCYK